ncbi:MAG: carbohydrate kinase family protein [Candidatus Hadarchaeota archaeon]
MTADIVGLGVCSIDQFALVDEFCKVDDKIWIKEFARMPGGVVANFNVGVARMGVKSGFMGSSGDDPNGHEIMQNFKKEGMDTGHFFLKKDKNTAVNIIVVDSHGQRQILQDPNMEKNVLLPNDIIPGYVAKAEIFHTDAVNMDSARKCMKIAKEAGKRVSFDLERHVAVYGLNKIKDLIEMTDILLPNRRGALELTKETDYKKAARKLLGMGPEIVVITLGDEGCWVATEAKEERVKIYDLQPVVDTTGAGDCFNSTFVSCIYKGMDPVEAADFATASAALSVMKVGAQTMPKWKEVEKLLAHPPKRGK